MTVSHVSLGFDDPRVSAPAYRGPDRRALGAPVATSRPRGARVVLFLLLSNAAVLAVATYGSTAVTTNASATQWLTASVAVVAALAGAIELMKWRLVGDAPALWIGTALLVYSAANIAFPGLVQSFGNGSAHSWDDLVRPASAFMVMGLLVIAAASPTIDASLRPRRVARAAGAIALVGLAAAIVSPDFRAMLGPAIDRAPGESSAAFGQVGVAVIWVALGAYYLLRQSSDDADTARPWVGVMLLGLAEARLGLAVSVTRDPSWLLASQLFRLLGMAAALVGTIHGLQLAFAQQRSRLLDSIVELGTARAQQRAAQATAEERAHDLRAALLGIGSAAMTLERYHEQISDDERASLTSALSAEIVRLQQFVSSNATASAPFDLADALHPLLTCAIAQGAEVDVDLGGLSVTARQTDVVEAVQNLVDNARRHAPRSPITVRAERRGTHVLVRVEDRGAGVPMDARQRVFERGWRADASTDGSGLGLYVASRLIRQQNGDLWVEDRPGGGASFVLSLPPAEGESA